MINHEPPPLQGIKIGASRSLPAGRKGSSQKALAQRESMEGMEGDRTAPPASNPDTNALPDAQGRVGNAIPPENHVDSSPDDAAQVDRLTHSVANIMITDKPRALDLQAELEARLPLAEIEPSVRAPTVPFNQPLTLPGLEEAVKPNENVPPLTTPARTEPKSCYQSTGPENPYDRYRKEGTIIMDIEGFSDFMIMKTEECQRTSCATFVRGLPWRILATPREVCKTSKSQKSLGFFLQCNDRRDREYQSWSCSAHAAMSIISKKKGTPNHERRISHTFYPKENDWGFSQFLNIDFLMNEENGFIKNDTVTLMVKLVADAPHGVQRTLTTEEEKRERQLKGKMYAKWDSKKHSGYNGLKNQGATCYMNSILQTLFFTNKLRKAVYHMDPSTGNDEPEKNIALALQRLFFELQFCTKPVGTMKLTKSFGWDNVESFVQHDVQELCRVLMDNLEGKMKNSPLENIIPSTFKGVMKNYIRCTRVDYESTKEENFYDIQLNIRPHGQPSPTGTYSLVEALEEYVHPEELDGDNKYDAGEYGLQPALKGISFKSFPKMLYLQLMRFQFDPIHEHTVKINDRFEFPDLLDLSDFVEGAEANADNKYYLFSVHVHIGDYHGGHYVVYINTDPAGKNEKWYKFDDDVVSRSGYREAVYNNYGGDDGEGMAKNITSAYMLVYVRKDSVDEILCRMEEEDIPPALLQRLRDEQAEESRIEREKLEAHLMLHVYYLTNYDLVGYHEFDLLNVRSIDKPARSDKVEKTMTLHAFYRILCARLWKGEGPAPEYDPARPPFRLWQFTDSPIENDKTKNCTLSRWRASSLVQYKPENRNRAIHEILECGNEKCLLYMELPEEGVEPPLLDPYHEARDLLVFFKFFDHRARTLRFVGTRIVDFKATLDTVAPWAASRVGLPEGTRIRFYEEVAPDSVQRIEHNIPISSENMMQEVSDGCILIFEEADPRMDITALTFLDDKYNTVKVKVCQNSDTSKFPMAVRDSADAVEMTVNLKWTVLRLAQEIGENIGWDERQLLIWKNEKQTDRPNVYIHDAYLKIMKVEGLLGLVEEYKHDPRKDNHYILYYNKLPVTIGDLEKRRIFRIQIVTDKFAASEVTVLPDKHGTCQSIIDEARRFFEEDKQADPPRITPPKLLRLLKTGISPSCLRPLCIVDPNKKISEIYTEINENNNVMRIQSQLRVEEIPPDQTELGPLDYLLPVCHFEKHLDKQFGTGFYFKLREGESFLTLRERLRTFLEVSEKEFDKYKFVMVYNSGRKALELNQTNNVMRFAEHNITGGRIVGGSPAIPYLGLEHFNRARPQKTSFDNKPIVIKN